MAKSAKGSTDANTHHGASHDHGAHHQELGFWRKYVFSTDHKIIGLQYGFTALLFLLFGFSLVMIMRWQLAYPGEAIPLIGWLFSDETMPGGVMLPEFYNQLGAMHGTIMVFLGVVPLAVGAFGNYVLPLQIGAPDMAFPKINMASYWAYFLGGVTMLASFFVPAGAAKAGWTSYPPLANIETMGQTMWLLGMIFLITSSLLGAVNFLTTIIQLRAEGLTYMRLPFFCVGAVCHFFPPVISISPPGSRGNSSIDGPPCRHQLFPSQWIGGKRPGAGYQRRGKPPAVAALILVPGAPGSVRAYFAGHGHYSGDYRQQHPQTVVGI